ncbi:hypothetical protein JG687_00003349 [Phytophthora cactorum]|uniref:Uncharacterized protein n=2 Tax=Phytophthora cactorum TaxID=29920 RepID=A0A8T1UVZ2_9STRA|nr:hypothetical protein JG687_00003349 [Phytophthora cactorum]
MVRVIRPPNPSYTNAQVAVFYFRPCRDQDDEVILEYFRCRCGTVRKQTNRNGYSNLMQHVLREHPDYEVVMLEATAAQTGSILNFIRHSSQNLFGWMVWIVQCNLPLSFCESREARRFSNLEPISEERLRAGMDGVVMAVERSIASELPASFGIMLDGWTYASDHYLAVFACYEVNGSLKTPLLSMAPVFNEANDDLSAESHLNFLATMLPRDFGFIGVEDDDIMELLPAPAANKRLLVLYQELRDIESVSKALQGNADRLTRAEKAVLPPFAATAPADARESLEEQQDSFVERLRKRRRLYEERVEYEQLKSIPPTSNVVERFFCVSRVTFGHQRHGLLPRTLEILLFLREYGRQFAVDAGGLLACLNE